ncbi:hypothetical protein ASG49_08280 [Marmoricola sp. Leaf446]|uniref:hypothetical protein n=1 Tax=Marmoricola sp. Leaf446 TaxID=1736379 RepID=UPI0006F36D1C|nr:hypothetical protein [Marmoricola sp. Leaf446]KQT91979.1 hypothetical protein ASG49_08280 [Marmoricola sp. Leaf446]
MARVQQRSPVRRLLVVATALLVVAVLVVTLLAALGRPSMLPGLADCTATVGDDEVDLTTAQAQRAATVAARAMRLDLRMRTTAEAVAGELDLSDDDAVVVAQALKGRAWHALSCTHGGGAAAEPDELDGRGLTGRAAAVREDLDEAFGEQRLGGFAPGGVSDGHMPGSAHYEGRAVDVFFRPVTRAQKVRGWAVAHYLVAHADRLAVETVIFDGRIWTARRALQGWRDYSPDTSGRSAEVAAVLEHRDHVHVDVAD